MPTIRQADVDALWRTTTASIARGDLRGAALAANMLKRYMRDPESPLPSSVYTLTGNVHEATARAMTNLILDLAASGGDPTRGRL